VEALQELNGAESGSLDETLLPTLVGVGDKYEYSLFIFKFMINMNMNRGFYT